MEAVVFAALVILSAAFAAVAAVLFVVPWRRETAPLDAATSGIQSELALVNLSLLPYLLGLVAFGALGAICTATTWSRFGGSLWIAVISTVGLGLFLFIPRIVLGQMVRREKADMEAALGTFQRLAAVAVAGGAEISFALRTAAVVGEGRSWQRLRAAAYSGLYSSRTFSSELAELGEIYNSSQLRNLANLVAISESGGLSQSSLERMAEAQTQHSNQELLALAERNTAKMVLPVALLFSAFATFVGFAVFQVLSEVQL